MTSGPDFTDPSQIASRTITYNADNMPVQIEHAGTVITDFIYDGNGVRAKKAVQGGGTTYYVNNNFEVINGEPVGYIFAGNLRIAKVTASGRNYFHKDHLDSSTVMTDETGIQVEVSEYMPFGHMRDHIGTEISNYKFTDQELDKSTNLYNYDARLYDPVIGRFISADSMVPDPFDPQSLNRYSYCLNNPLIYIDPNGHYQINYNFSAPGIQMSNDFVSSPSFDLSPTLGGFSVSVIGDAARPGETITGVAIFGPAGGIFIGEDGRPIGFFGGLELTAPISRTMSLEKAVRTLGGFFGWVGGLLVGSNPEHMPEQHNDSTINDGGCDSNGSGRADSGYSDPHAGNGGWSDYY